MAERPAQSRWANSGNRHPHAFREIEAGVCRLILSKRHFSGSRGGSFQAPDIAALLGP
jgi:hypothetical protein